MAAAKGSNINHAVAACNFLSLQVRGRVGPGHSPSSMRTSSPDGDISSAQARRMRLRTDRLRLPRSTSLMYVRCKPDRLESSSWEIPSSSRLCRTTRESLNRRGSAAFTSLVIDLSPEVGTTVLPSSPPGQGRCFGSTATQTLLTSYGHFGSKYTLQHARHWRITYFG